MNPNELNKLKRKGGYYTKYKIVAIQNNEGDFNFFAAKFYQNVDTQNSHLINSEVSFSNSKNYSGIIYLVDKEKNFVYTKKVDKGNVTHYSPFKTKKESSTSTFAKSDSNCETVRLVTEYTDWYNISSDEDGIFIVYQGTTITGYDYEEICITRGSLPEMNRFGPNGAGIYKKTGTNNTGEKEEKIAFINDAISYCGPGLFPNSNGDCVKDLEDHIDSSDLTGKAECLNDSLTKDSNDFVKDLLANFNGNSEFNINISSKDKIFRKNTNIELNGKTTYLPGSSLININISTGRLSNMSSLAGIRTILHEYIHADMFRKLNTKYSINGDLDFKQTFNHFKNVNFKPDPQHETMAKLYLNEMILALKNTHQKLIPNEVKYYKENYPLNTLDNIYEALAWQGLKNHKLQAWLDKGKDTIKINNTINTNLSGLTKNFCK